MEQGWVGHGSARAVLWLLPSARALTAREAGRGRPRPSSGPGQGVVPLQGSLGFPREDLPQHQHVPVRSAYKRGEQSTTCSSLAWQGCLVPALGARVSQGGEVKGCPIHREQPLRTGPCQPLGALYPRAGALLSPGSTVTPRKDLRPYAVLAVLCQQRRPRPLTRRCKPRPSQNSRSSRDKRLPQPRRPCRARRHRPPCPWLPPEPRTAAGGGTGCSPLHSRPRRSPGSFGPLLCARSPAAFPASLLSGAAPLPFSVCPSRSGPRC